VPLSIIESQCYDSQHDGRVDDGMMAQSVMLGVVYAHCHLCRVLLLSLFVECRYSECRHAECRSPLLLVSCNIV
jgi:hypothetical protein